MRALVRRSVRLALVVTLGAGLVACSSTPLPQTTAAPAVQTGYTQTSIAHAGSGAWTTAAPAGYQGSAVRPGTCYVAPRTAALPTPPCPTDCAPGTGARLTRAPVTQPPVRQAPVTQVTADRVERPAPPYMPYRPTNGRLQAAPRPVVGTTPPPPAPRSNYAADIQNMPAPGAAPLQPRAVPPECGCPPAAQPVQYVAQVPPRQYDGCGLPCMDGISQWHVRGLGGIVTYSGDDPGDDCGYAGVDLGRTFCGCWGLDLFYRWNSGQFERLVAAGVAKDGGDWHHVGVKVSKEFAFGDNSPFYAYVGAGPQYFWTEDYISDDDGFGFFGEVGIGYALSRNFRIRAGVDFHGVNTSVTRRDPANDGDDRFLWLIAPNIGIEFDW